jgi:hypothetical protein
MPFGINTVPSTSTQLYNTAGWSCFQAPPMTVQFTAPTVMQAYSMTGGTGTVTLCAYAYNGTSWALLAGNYVTNPGSGAVMTFSLSSAPTVGPGTIEYCLGSNISAFHFAGLAYSTTLWQTDLNAALTVPTVGYASSGYSTTCPSTMPALTATTISGAPPQINLIP